MGVTQKIEYWLRGPVTGVPGLLQPVAHALLQARDEVTEAMLNCPEELLWEKPAGAASLGFHLRHLTGVLDRLFTYARGEQLNELQLVYLGQEGQKNESIRVVYLLEQFHQQVEKSIEQLIHIDPKTLTDTRGVGRKQVPSTVIGLLFHAAEHTMRHTGQLLVTAITLAAQHRSR